MANTKAADDLATQGAKPSAAMGLVWFSQLSGTLPSFECEILQVNNASIVQKRNKSRNTKWTCDPSQNSPHAGISAISSDASVQSSTLLHTRTSLTVVPSLQRYSPETSRGSCAYKLPSKYALGYGALRFLLLRLHWASEVTLKP